MDVKPPPFQLLVDEHGAGLYRFLVASVGPAHAASPTPVLPGDEDRDLWEAVARLPQRQREALTLRFLGDLSYASIADVLGGNENAARQNVHKGLARLRKEFGCE